MWYILLSVYLYVILMSIISTLIDVHIYIYVFISKSIEQYITLSKDWNLQIYVFSLKSFWFVY